jgi:hypothetical protein
MKSIVTNHDFNGRMEELVCQILGNSHGSNLGHKSLVTCVQTIKRLLKPHLGALESKPSLKESCDAGLM